MAFAGLLARLSDKVLAESGGHVRSFSHGKYRGSVCTDRQAPASPRRASIWRKGRERQVDRVNERTGVVKNTKKSLVFSPPEEECCCQAAWNVVYQAGTGTGPPIINHFETSLRLSTCRESRVYGWALATKSRKGERAWNGWPIGCLAETKERRNERKKDNFN